MLSVVLASVCQTVVQLLQENEVWSEETMGNSRTTSVLEYVSRSYRIIFYQATKENIMSASLGVLNFKWQASLHPPVLVNNPIELLSAWGAKRSIFNILSLPKFYFLQKQGKWKPHLLNYLMLLRTPLFVNFQVEMEIVFISLIFICYFHAPNLCVSWSKVTVRSSSQFKSDILCYIQHIAGLEN